MVDNHHLGMMKTTLLHAENLLGADAFGSPPISASASSMLQVAIGDESSDSGNRAGDMALASLWIRRLKPRMERASAEGETFVSDNETLHTGNSDPCSSMHPALQEASAMKILANKPLSEIRKLDEEKAVFKLALNKQVSSSKQEDFGGERPRNRFKQGQGRIIPDVDPYSTGFGQQMNQSADTKSERKSLTSLMTVDKNVNSRSSPGATTISHTCNQAAENKNQFVHAVRVQAAEGGIFASSLGKPPLPPSRNKAGLPPRPAGCKSSGIIARPAGKITSLPTNNKLAAITSQDISGHPSHTAVVKESLLTTTGPLSKDGHQAKEGGMGRQDLLSKEDGMCIEGRRILADTRVFNSISVAPKYDPSVEPGMQQHPVSHSKESSKNADYSGTGKQASGTLMKEPKTPFECSVVWNRVEETTQPARSALTTASFPWEMFAGAAGPSRSAREEFVEVYNRARNELKKQKFSSSITQVFHKGMDDRLGHARCLPDTSIVKLEGPASDQQQQQSEIAEKSSKFDGIDFVFQQGGVRVAGPGDRFPQKELSSEEHNCASFLKGDYDINPGKKSQTFQSVHVAYGKESSTRLLDQCGGQIHGCVELPAVGQKDCTPTLEENPHCRQGFAMPEGAASSHRKLCEPPYELRMFDRRSPSIITDQESFQRVTLPRKSDVWLQRWYPPAIAPRIEGSQERKSNRVGQDLAGNMLPVNESDERAACVKDLKKGLIETDALYQRIMTGGEPKQLKASSEKVLPSAAAMAIVGSVARHFCAMQCQHKRSFAFWSGFGMPAPQTPDHFTEYRNTPEHFTEEGQGQLTFKADAAHV